MTLTENALTWQGITIGGPDSDLYIEGGVEGLGRTPATPTSTPRSTGGVWGGLSKPEARTITAEVWLNAGSVGVKDYSALWAIDAAMQERARPTDEIPLAWAGFMWPSEHCVFARPVQCDWLTSEEGYHDGAPGLDLQWVASDPTRYEYEPTTAAYWPTDDPVDTAEFQAPNSGLLVPYARRSWNLRMTAHGTVRNPWIRVDHADGTFEKITLSGLTMTGGQVLKIEEDLLPRVDGRIVSGHIRSVTQLGRVARAPRWWLLHPSDGEDDANVVTMGVTSGSWSGFMKTRGGR